MAGMNVTQSAVKSAQKKKETTMLKKFASIADKQYGYSYDSQAFDVHAPIDCHFRMFDTYADGLTQHSPDWSVQLDHLADYLASLAEAMLTDEELARNCLFTFSRRPSVKAIEFAASVKFKAAEEKDWLRGRRWFSAKELKLSKSPSREHDKRYEEVREVHDELGQLHLPHPDRRVLKRAGKVPDRGRDSRLGAGAGSRRALHADASGVPEVD